MAFGPGLHVFPGGRVDPEDAATLESDDPAWSGDGAGRALGHNVPPLEALAIHRAAIRELREEAGIQLVGPDRLVPIAHWTTPGFMPRRFSTWFFVADLPTGPDPVFAPDEVADHAWLTPLQALNRLGTGEIDMWVPTTSVLERLIETGARTADEVAARITLTRVEPPRIHAETATEVRFVFGAAGGLPGRGCETRLIGRRDVVVVDPGDASDEALRAIEEAAGRRGGAIRAVVLTATDPDHAAGAEAIAIPHEVPVLAAPGAGRHLPYEVLEVADGDRLPSDVAAMVRLTDGAIGRLEVVTSAGE